ncbi:MAG: DUF2391 family protein [Opitutales bacterium]
MKRPTAFDSEDLSQLLIGALSVSVPIAFSEESWTLGATLPTWNLALIASITLAFLSIFTHHSVFRRQVRYRWGRFVARVIFAYLLTATVVSVVLMALGKFPLLSEPAAALGRVIVVAMPASMGAIIVDGLDKE